MKRRNFIELVALSGSALTLNVCCTSESKNKKWKEANIVVYGGTPGGIGAAIQAARMGESVLLIEPTNHIGGILVNGMGSTDIDNQSGFQNSLAVGGIALEFYQRIAQEYDRLEDFNKMIYEKEKKGVLWKHEPHVAERVIQKWLNEYPIEVLTGTYLIEQKDAIEKRSDRIITITTNKGIVNGQVFIDATLEGDLIQKAGISYTVGREDNSIYGETRNGILKDTTHSQFQVKIDPYNVEGNPSSGLIPTVQNDPLGMPGSGDLGIQAFCYRPSLTNDPDNKIDFSPPSTYDRSSYEIYLRYLRANGRLYRPFVNMPNDKCDLNAWHDLCHNLYGMNHEYPDGSYKVRKQILDSHTEFTKGLFYFLSTDSEVGKLDKELQESWSSWGYAKDEFTDRDYWPEQIYVRDGRRMISDYVITERHADKSSKEEAEAPVAIAFWPPDLHSARRIVVNNRVYNEGAIFSGTWWKPFGISYRSLIPKREECVNLLTPTCPSSSHVAYGAIRIECTFMALGQATGVAAAIANMKNQEVQDVEYNEIRRELLEGQQKIDVNEI